MRTWTLVEARRAWLAAQSLARVEGDGRRSLGAILTAGGWMYSAGGCGPALSVLARRPSGFRTRELDEAVSDGREVVEAPGPRGATFLVPAAERAIALAFAQRVDAERWRKLAADNLDPVQFEALCDAVADSVAASPRSMADLPRRLAEPVGAVGKKLGERSTLGLAVKRLLAEGRARRAPERLDAAEYQLVAADPPAPVTDPVAAMVVPWFRANGPATLGEYAWWAGASQREAGAAVGAAGAAMEGVQVEGLSGTRFVIAGASGQQRAPLAEASWWPAEAAAAGGVAAESWSFLPFRDNLPGRRASAFVDPVDADATVLDWNGRPARLALVDSLHHHAVFRGSRLVGAWEWDVEGRSPIVRLFSERPDDAFTLALSELAAFIQAELGDARFYPLDRGPQRRRRLAALQSAVGSKSTQLPSPRS